MNENLRTQNWSFTVCCLGSMHLPEPAVVGANRGPVAANCRRNFSPDQCRAAAPFRVSLPGNRRKHEPHDRASGLFPSCPRRPRGRHQFDSARHLRRSWHESRLRHAQYARRDQEPNRHRYKPLHHSERLVEFTRPVLVSDGPAGNLRSRSRPLGRGRSGQSGSLQFSTATGSFSNRQSHRFMVGCPFKFGRYQSGLDGLPKPRLQPQVDCHTGQHLPNEHRQRQLPVCALGRLCAEPVRTFTRVACPGKSSRSTQTGPHRFLPSATTPTIRPCISSGISAAG